MIIDCFPSQLCRQKDERASALEALTRSASEMEQKMEAAAELLAKNSNTVVSKGRRMGARRAGLGRRGGG